MSDKKPSKPAPKPAPRPQPAGSHEVRGDTRVSHTTIMPERKGGSKR